MGILTGSAQHWLAVAVPTPAHSNLSEPLTYGSAAALPAGTLVRVPLGRREVLGMVWRAGLPPPGEELAAQVRPVTAVHDLAPLGDDWRDLLAFAARYYQRALGEVALAALPPQLRRLTPEQLGRRLARLGGDPARVSLDATLPQLTPEQQQALAAVEAGGGPFLLHGVTGSGKTEVYMRAAQTVLERDPAAQVLVLVPEINLTPQLEERFSARFGESAVVSLHSGLTPARRLGAWLAAHTGHARIVLGTRVAVLASLPRLALIVVDEEHDPSYKQQEGARYSARDLALYRASLLQVPVVLGSATPSLESWHASTPVEQGGRGRYQRLELPRRVDVAGAGAGLPQVLRIDMSRQPRGTLLAPPLVGAIAECVGAGRQALLLLNRRGYAPLLHCPDCGWKSECPHCSAYRVFHKLDRSVRCHHCGFAERVPRACPNCGNADLQLLGRGTEQLEERLPELLAEVRRPDGGPLRVGRIDADSTRHKGQLEQRLAQVHAGEVDLLVGTQMIAKGHDFRRVGLVAAVNPDLALYSSDFRAPERLFALLMQAAGRAGRDTRDAVGGQMWVQTEQPAHPLYEALKQHDYAGFAQRALEARQQAGLPPFSHLALLRVDARTQERAQDLLGAVARHVQGLMAQDAHLAAAGERVTWYPAVPLAVQRVARVERAQMLLESNRRRALQAVLPVCAQALHTLRGQRPFRSGIVRWAIDVDPLAV